MNIKLDENLGLRGAQRFRNAGHDVATVPDQGLCSASDHQLISVCRKENRCLVSLDLDFANPMTFEPAEYAGIAVLRVPPKSTAEVLFQLIDSLIAELKTEPIQGQMWIVEPGRIRVHQVERKKEP